MALLLTKHELGHSNAPIVTFGKSIDIENKIVETILAEAKDGHSIVRTDYLTETRFNKAGIERKTVSDFGFIGWIIAQFGKDQ